MRVAVILVLLALVAPIVAANITTPVVAPTLLADVPAGSAVAVDSHGSIILGTTKGGVQKYDATGNLQWQDTPYPTQYSIGTFIGVDNHDNILVAGTAGGPIVKYAPDGKVLWRTPDPGFDEERGIAVDKDGNALVAFGQVGVGSGVWKVSSNGASLWKVVAGFTNPSAIAVSPDGHVAVARWDNTIFLDANGNLLWERTPGGTGVAVGPDNSVYVGRQSGWDVLGNGVGYLVKFAPDGTVLWNKPEAAPFLAMSGASLIAANVFVAAPLPIYPIPGVKAFVVNSFDAGTGVWQWGFKHITGTSTGLLGAGSGNVYVRPGYIALTAYSMDTPLYQGWLLNACDATPLMSTPVDARACVFTPV